MLLASVAMSTASDDRKMEGAEEWSFWSAYMPSGVAAASTAASETAHSSVADEREAKSQKTGEPKGNGGRGKAQGWGSTTPGATNQGWKRNQRPFGRGGGDQSWDAWRAGAGDGGEGGRDLRALNEVMEMMQRLFLRHEDAINLLRLEYSFVAHMRLNVPSSVVPMLYVAADGWRKLKANEPEKLDRPMRTSLFVCYFAELRARLEALPTKPTDIEKLVTLGWLSTGPPMVWPFLKWDSVNQRTIVDTSKEPLSQSAVIEHIDILLRDVVSGTSLARFHPTRPMAEEMRGDSVVFLIQVSTEGEPAANMRASLKALCHNAALQLVATQLKADRANRSTLANSLAATIPRST